jgi:lantibiotic modifying enzyme
MCSDDAFLAMASAIGRLIVEAAVWDRGRCSWMGAVANPRQPWPLEYRALGPSPYHGTAGVGLFLAQLAALTGGQPARRTALGALHHALERATSLPRADRDGLHTGVLGVALAAVRAATWIGEPELEARARALVGEVELPSGPDRCPDVLMGSAGSIIGLLALAEALEDPRLVERAAAAGVELLEHATVTPHGWSWASPGYRYPQHLCGLSHGAGGIGWALVELFAATGDERFRLRALVALRRLRALAGPPLPRPTPRARPRRGVAGNRHLVPRRGGHRDDAFARRCRARLRGGGPRRRARSRDDPQPRRGSAQP